MNKLSFDLNWEYTETTGMMAMAMAVWQPVHLPHDLSISKARSESSPTTGGGGFAWSGVVTYRKRFLVPDDWRGQSVQLEFEGVYMNAEVSINRQVVALHPYGYTSFVVDLTPHLKFGQENELVVVANNSAQPNSRWYSGTGIYRHVWLRIGNEAHIKPWGVFVTTPTVTPAAASVQVVTELAGAAAGAMLRSTILDASGAVVAQMETPVQAANIEQTLTVPSAQLWSVDAPYLYTLLSELVLPGGRVDSERTPFGIRTFSVDTQHGFRLNGVGMKLKGGCVHHDNGLLGAASYDRAEERKIELMKASGYNAIRCAHNPPAPAMLAACDRLGMLVIDESFDCWRTGKNSNDYHLYFEDWWQRDTESMVRRDRNHPSIIIWSIGNEVAERAGLSDGAAWAQRQADFVRALDPTRLVTSALPLLFEEMFADPEILQSMTDMQSLFDPKKLTPTDPASDRWGNLTRAFNEAFELVGYNYLYPRYDYDGQHFPGRVIAGTETFPYDAYEYWKATERLPYVIGDFVWTSIDYLGESGLGKYSFIEDERPDDKLFPYHLANCGDIDICGFKRPQSYFRDILWGVRSAPYIAVLNPRHTGKKGRFSLWAWEPVEESWTFPGLEGQPTQVYVYSAADEVEVLVNGVSAGSKPAGAAAKNKVSFEVSYQPGTIEAVSYCGGQETGRTHLHTSGPPARLSLSADRPALRAEFGDLAYVTVEIQDGQGNRVPCAEAVVTLEVSGAGDLLAIGTANPISEEQYVGSQRQAWQGRLMAVVRASGQPGSITLTAQVEGLPAAEIELRAQEFTHNQPL